MIILDVSDDNIEEAELLYPFHNLNNSITGGRSQLYGAIGEVMVKEYYDASYVGDYDYDLSINNFRVEVKTKRTSVTPQPHYWCSVPALNTKQDCDYYYFTRVSLDYRRCYLLGYLPKEKFFAISVFMKKGDLDGDHFTIKEDCYSVPVGDLWLKKKIITIFVSCRLSQRSRGSGCGPMSLRWHSDGLMRRRGVGRQS